MFTPGCACARRGLAARGLRVVLIFLRMSAAASQSEVHGDRNNSDSLPSCDVPQQFYQRINGRVVCANCFKCPPGWGVDRECIDFNDTTCKRCEEGKTYSLEYPHTRVCDVCKVCEGQIVVRRCTVYTDVLCGRCKPGFVLDDSTLECEPVDTHRSWRGMVSGKTTVISVTQGVSTAAVTRVKGSPASGELEDAHVLVYVSVPLALLIIGPLVAILCWKRKWACKLLAKRVRDTQRQGLLHECSEVANSESNSETQVTPEGVAVSVSCQNNAGSNEVSSDTPSADQSVLLDPLGEEI
ncbi:tumor necrosis factor receptor superfamily member 10B isoform X1 [Lingula anatina]|uniref:Tumor necrosis factor receptor superfamily member 10B isoform X1 n=1 Tax=Lingula anatina TaxID=7574 RepID=A0A1S3K3S1_LINAN|nr:tumor necrosis factor receptor superfamily member 10B isoform X1 [Lingula anatina]|eukprot:XP_013417172.1 tumor necrosis factor receptor superfamily member 10B isoform X1 [Lingula anatina]